MAGSGGVCLLLELEYADGRRESVYTDGSWRWMDDGGPLGERALPGWKAVGFDDSGWKAVRPFTDALAAPWASLADMSKLLLPAERKRKADIFAAR